VSQTETAITTSSNTSNATNTSSSIISEAKNQPKRLHVSNIPFRFRDPDLRAMFGVGSHLYLCRAIASNISNEGR